MKNFLLALLLLPSLVLAGGTYYQCASGECERVGIDEMPNPSSFNPALGVDETGDGGTLYFDDNVANASFQVTTGVSRLVRFIIGGDTATTVTFYDDSDGTCSTLQKTPTYTSPSITAPGTYEIRGDFANGICMLTAGGAGAADISVVTLP